MADTIHYSLAGSVQKVAASFELTVSGDGGVSGWLSFDGDEQQLSVHGFIRDHELVLRMNQATLIGTFDGRALHGTLTSDDHITLGHFDFSVTDATGDVPQIRPSANQLTHELRERGENSPETNATLVLGRSVEDVLVGACGFVTSLGTGVLLWIIERWTGFAFYTWMYWFVVPLGAGLSGFCGASGYYIGAKYFGHRPSKIMLVNVVLASLSTFVLVHYLSYRSLIIDGRHVGDYVSFSQYLDIAIRTTSMTFNMRGQDLGSTGELGSFGYVVALLQIVGFAFGGFTIYTNLGKELFCERCSKYLKRNSVESRYYESPDAFGKVMGGLVKLLQTRQFDRLKTQHTLNGTAKHTKGRDFSSTMTIRCCPACGARRIELQAKRLVKDQWCVIPDVNYFVDAPADKITV